MRLYIKIDYYFVISRPKIALVSCIFFERGIHCTFAMRDIQYYCMLLVVSHICNFYATKELKVDFYQQVNLDLSSKSSHDVCNEMLIRTEQNNDAGRNQMH